jgi:AraC-like DNA-binding protein
MRLDTIHSTETASEPGRTLSVRLLWPFLPALPAVSVPWSILARNGIHPRHLARPDSRVSSGAALSALRTYVASTGDLGIGARAGVALEPGDLGVFEQAALACESLGEALACAARHVHLLYDDAELVVVDADDEVLVVFRAEREAPAQPAATAFVVTAAAMMIRRLASLDEPFRALHVRAEALAGTDGAIDRLGLAVRTAMPHDGVALDRARLDARLPRSSAAMREAFESYADELADRDALGYRRRAREVAASELRSGQLSMASAASALGVSPSTLRRRLQEEHTTYRAIIDEVRCDLAERYLVDRRMRIGEIACLLGFSSVAAFNKAFRRWKGVNPSAHRSNAS